MNHLCCPNCDWKSKPIKAEGNRFARSAAEGSYLDHAQTHIPGPIEEEEAVMSNNDVPEGYVDIVFDGPPTPRLGRFIGTEGAWGSVGIGEWVKRGDWWALRIPDPRPR